MGSLHSTKNFFGCASIDDDSLLVGPTSCSAPINPKWLTNAFIVTAGIDDEVGYDKLRIPKISSADWYLLHFFPFMEEFDATVLIAVLQFLLDSFYTFKADVSFMDFLKANGTDNHTPIRFPENCKTMTLWHTGRFVTTTGTIVHVGELVIPADDACALLMDTSVAPAQELTGDLRSKALVELGARSRPGLDDIKRAISSLTAASKSGWTDDVPAKSQQHLTTAIASVEIIADLVSDAQGEIGDALLDTAGRTVAAAAQLICCPSLDISFATLPL
jgi:hypothetical protein